MRGKASVRITTASRAPIEKDLPAFHVVPRKDGLWEVRIRGKDVSEHATQQQAIEAAKTWAEAAREVVVLHDLRGSVQGQIDYRPSRQASSPRRLSALWRRSG
jgi:uncharacterized protein DUF2188